MLGPPLSQFKVRQPLTETTRANSLCCTRVNGSSDGAKATAANRATADFKLAFPRCASLAGSINRSINDRHSHGPQVVPGMAPAAMDALLQGSTDRTAGLWFDSGSPDEVRGNGRAWERAANRGPQHTCMYCCPSPFHPTVILFGGGPSARNSRCVYDSTGSCECCHQTKALNATPLQARETLQATFDAHERLHGDEIYLGALDPDWRALPPTEQQARGARAGAAAPPACLPACLPAAPLSLFSPSRVPPPPAGGSTLPAGPAKPRRLHGPDRRAALSDYGSLRWPAAPPATASGCVSWGPQRPAVPACRWRLPGTPASNLCFMLCAPSSCTHVRDVCAGLEGRLRALASPASVAHPLHCVEWHKGLTGTLLNLMCIEPE